MELYHSSYVAPPSSTFSHFGTFDAAVIRTGSIFCAQNALVHDGESFIATVQDSNRNVAHLRVDERQVIKRFAEHLSKFTIYKTVLDVKKPLRLFDCWTDDPIGSGGPGIFREAGLSSAQNKEVARLFYPFTDIIYPEHVNFFLSNSDIVNMQREIYKNHFFKGEFEKRKRRLGDRFKVDHPYEVAWTFMTMKVHQWALQNGHDSFVYKNNGEGNEDAYVNFSPKQIKVNGQLRFDEDHFLREALPRATERIRTFWEETERLGETISDGQKLFWGPLEPCSYWHEMPIVPARKAGLLHKLGKPSA